VRITIAALLLSGCIDAGAFFFAPRRLDREYRWDEIDPALDGDISEPHASIVGPGDRDEGFLDVDGLAVHWVIARRPGATDAILYSHGNGVHLGHYWDRVERLWELGFTVLIYDYPGYGRSEGDPTEAGVYAAGQAALERLAEEDVERIWLYGFSIGGAPTYELAARSERGEAPDVAGLISEGTFCSAEDLLEDGTQVGIDGHFITRVSLDNCARMRELTDTPALIMHGTEDFVVLVRHAALLREAAIDTPVTVRIIDGGTHLDVPLADSYDEWVVDHIGQ
jgi:alpha-beta hydrolase superfamily lysophospholipase